MRRLHRCPTSRPPAARSTAALPAVLVALVAGLLVALAPPASAERGVPVRLGAPTAVADAVPGATTVRLPLARGAVPAASLRSSSSTVAPDGAWCWFGDPRAVRHRGTHDRTYLGWLTRTGEVQVGSYDHRTGAFATATLVTGFPVDDHNNPAVVVRPDGRLMVFWSGHVGPQMHYRVATDPESIAAWDEPRTLPVQLPAARGYTYPNPVFVPGEGDRLYLFWRGGSQPAVSWSDDLGETWAPARQLLAIAGHRPYVKVALAPDGTLGLAFTDAHPRERDVNDVHYAALRKGGLYRSDGRLVGRLADGPRSPDDFETVHAQATWGARAWVHDLAFDRASRPVVVLAAFPSSRDHRYRYARRTAAGWQVTEMVAAGPAFETSGREPYYSGGITLDHEDPSVAYLSRQVGATWEVERWRTADGGRTWAVTELTSGSAEPNVRPVSPRGSAGGALDVLWMAGGYAHYTSYTTGIGGTAGAADPRPAARVVASAGAARLTYGDPLTVRAGLAGAAGTPLPGRAVTLWHAPPRSPATAVARATTDRTGTAVFRVPARATGVHEVRFSGDARSGPSSSVRLPVLVSPVGTAVTAWASADTVRPGAAVRIGARLVRADDGRTVAYRPLVLYRRAPGQAAATPVGTARTDARGVARWDLVPAAPATTFSVRSPGTPAYRASASAAVAVAVRVPTVLALDARTGAPTAGGRPTVSLRAVLRTAPAGPPLAGRPVRVWARWTTTARWTLLGTPVTGADGSVALAHRPTAATVYRADFAGDGELASATRTVTVPLPGASRAR